MKRKHKCLTCRNFRVVESLGVKLIQYCETSQEDVTYEDVKDCHERSKMSDKDYDVEWERIGVIVKKLMKYGL